MNNFVSTKNLNILKAALPFFPVALQKNLSYFVKVSEFHNMFNNLSHSLDATISACELNGGQNTPFQISDLLFAIKPYLDKNEADMINTFMNVTNAIHLYQSVGNNPSALLNSMMGNAAFNSSPDQNQLFADLLRKEATEAAKDVAADTATKTDVGAAVNNADKTINTATDETASENNTTQDFDISNSIDALRSLLAAQNYQK